MKLINTTKNIVICNDIEIAGTFIKRFLGLMFRKSLDPNSGLVISPCNSIHMFFMRFSIDVLFVDKDNKVVYFIKDIKPWRVSKVVWNAKYVIELASGKVDETNIEVGDYLNLD